MNIYQSNSYRENLSWLHFDDQPRFQETQQVKGQPHTFWRDVIIVRFLRIKCEILLGFELNKP